MIVNRRGLLVGLGSMLAAPAIVHAQNLMPIKALKPEPRIPLIGDILMHNNAILGVWDGREWRSKFDESPYRWHQ